MTDNAAKHQRCSQGHKEPEVAKMAYKVLDYDGRLKAECQAGQASCAACLTVCPEASYDMLCTHATNTSEAGQVLLTVGRLWADYGQTMGRGV